MSGPVETERPLTIFRRPEKLRLTLHRSLPTNTIPIQEEISKSKFKTIDAHELAEKLFLERNSRNNSSKFLLLDCRGSLSFWEHHIIGAVHIACSDRFHRKRLRNSSVSILDLVSTNNRINQSNCFPQTDDLSEVIVYDEGNSDLNLMEDSSAANSISFVLQKLVLEDKQPVYLQGGFKEFSRNYKELCGTCSTQKDLKLEGNSRVAIKRFPPLTLPNSTSGFSLPLSPKSESNSYTNVENQPLTKILPLLYVGNEKDAKNLALLEELGISYILSVTDTNPHPSANAGVKGESMATPRNNENIPGFRKKLVQACDNLQQNLLNRFDECYDFIEEGRKTGKGVLIHCHAGISRSPTIAIAYCIRHLGLKTNDAYSLVQQRRKIISPNLSFMGQLLEYEQEVKRRGHLGSIGTTLCNNVNNTTSDISEGRNDELGSKVGP